MEGRLKKDSEDEVKEYVAAGRLVHLLEGTQEYRASKVKAK